MSTLRITLALGLIALALVTGCSSDSSSTNPTPTTSYFMKATVDGTAFEASESTCLAVRSSILVSIAGSTVTNPPRQINIALVSPVAGETYTFGTLGSLNTATIALGLTPEDVYTATALTGSGSVKITKLDATAIEGTFSFTGANNEGATKEATNGSFRCKF